MNISDIKKQSSLSLEGNLFKAIGITIFYTLITVLFAYIPSLFKETLPNELISVFTILLNLIILPFSYGMIASLVKISKDEKTNFTDFINIGLLNYFKIIKLVLSIALRLIPYVLILIIGLTLTISNFENDAIKTLGIIISFVSIIILIIKLLDYVLFNFININDNKKTCKEILSESKTLMKNHKIKLILLVFSYVFWFILFGLILKLASSFVSADLLKIISSFLLTLITPFITVSQYLFYEDLKNNNK